MRTRLSYALRYRNTDCLTAAAECLPSRVSNSRCSVVKNDSAQALCQQFPCSSHALPNHRAAFPQRLEKPVGTLLHALMGMQPQTLLGLAMGKGHAEGEGRGVEGLEVPRMTFRSYRSSTTGRNSPPPWVRRYVRSDVFVRLFDGPTGEYVF